MITRWLRAWRYFLLDRVLLRLTGIYVSCTHCFDCGSDDDWYMLRDEVWTATGMGKHGHLCIACVEQRLGRLVTRADFTDASVNDLWAIDYWGGLPGPSASSTG